LSIATTVSPRRRVRIDRVRHPDAAEGAAILSASNTLYAGLGAAAAMPEVEREINPGSLADAYESSPDRFVTALTERGSLAPAPLSA
jgi:hypothetical protein